MKGVAIARTIVILRASDEVRGRNSGGSYRRCPKDLKFGIWQGVPVEVLRAQKTRPQDDKLRAEPPEVPARKVVRDGQEAAAP